MSAIVYQLPDFSRAKKIHLEEQQNYMNSFNASAAIGMNAHLFNRITGVVFVYSGEKRYPISDADKKVNIGLQLKHFKQVLFSQLFGFLLKLGTNFNHFLLQIKLNLERRSSWLHKKCEQSMALLTKSCQFGS